MVVYCWVQEGDPHAVGKLPEHGYQTVAVIQLGGGHSEILAAGHSEAEAVARPAIWHVPGPAFIAENQAVHFNGTDADSPHQNWRLVKL